MTIHAAQRARARPPATVAWLGYGGLLPFVGMAIGVALAGPHAPFWSQALTAYGALIVGFVGALHWAWAMSAPGLAPQQQRWAFIWSVVPTWLGWLAIMLGGTAGNLVLVLGLVTHFDQDRRLAGPAGLPAWYLPLRARLTGVASLSLLINAWAG